MCFEQQSTIIAKVDTHIRKTNLLVVYTNDPVVMENSINTIEQLLAKDDNYRVVGFDLEYINSHAGHYMVGVGEKKKKKDSLVDLVAAIIKPYYRYMKAQRQGQVCLAQGMGERTG
ncbi:putative methyltransferase PMT27 [Hordeum vulgare]|nr:putative methyltransferase PMT27 [Hordeum vulgare]